MSDNVTCLTPTSISPSSEDNTTGKGQGVIYGSTGDKRLFICVRSLMVNKDNKDYTIHYADKMGRFLRFIRYRQRLNRQYMNQTCDNQHCECAFLEILKVHIKALPHRLV